MYAQFILKTDYEREPTKLFAYSHTLKYKHSTPLARFITFENEYITATCATRAKNISFLTLSN